MRITAAFLLGLMSLPAFAAPRGDELLLQKRHVDLRVDEDVATAALSWTVFNPGLRPLEGEVRFRVPKGATVTGAEIRKHIGSADHRSKLLDAARADALYEAIRRRDLKDPELQEIAEIESLVKAAGSHVQDSRPQQVPNWHEAWRRSHQAPGAFGVNNANADPALVDLVAEDTYRLRFSPVPPNDDQTVTVTVRFQAEKDGADRVVRLPLAFKDAFVAGPKTEAGAAIRLRSALPLEFGGSRTHALEPAGGAAKSREVVLRAREEGRPAELAFRYRLDPRAPQLPYEPVEGVSRAASLLVVDASDRRQSERRGEVPPLPILGPADLRRCGFIRPGAAGCGERSVVTNDPVRLQWSRERGLALLPCTRRTAFGSEKAFAFDYVAHAAGCPLQEADPQKLRALAAALK